MPQTAKKAPRDHQGKVEGKTFIWKTEDGAILAIPLRIKMKVIRAIGGADLDAAGMFDLVDAIAPGQAEIIDEMDTGDFQRAFVAFQAEYTKLNGATPGE